MLSFFRKYQKIIFYVVTVIIVISFSFFGTYRSLSGGLATPKEAFKAVNGKSVSTLELNNFVNFIAGDADDAMNNGNTWDGNLLNNGVIAQDILIPGIGTMIFERYHNILKDDIELRHSTERRYQAYRHPEVPMLSAETIWSYFTPELLQYYQALKHVDTPYSSNAFDTRVQLYLSERVFSQQLLKQILTYQQSQYNWISADRSLQQQDLSLFGYHNLKDWFGSRFLDIVAEFIINASIIAEERGYTVSEEEVIADMMYNLNKNLAKQSPNTSSNIVDASDYFSEQLRRLNIDKSTAINIWHSVMLFRRIFDDVDKSILVDALPYKTFETYANETTDVKAYQLPAELIISNVNDLRLLENYLKAVSSDYKSTELALPTNFLDTNTVKRNHPELVQKRFLAEISSISKKDLEIKIAVREVSEWQLDPNHWEILQKQFPLLNKLPSKDQDQRFESLSSLESSLKAEIDAFTRSQIVEEHPEWLKEGLDKALKERKLLSLRLKGENQSLIGISDTSELLKILEKSDINNTITYTPDNEIYYSIKVIEKSNNYEILTFSEALLSKAINTTSDSSWDKQFKQLKDAIIKNYKEHVVDKNNTIDKASDDFIAAHRMYYHVNKCRDLLQNGDTSLISDKKNNSEAIDHIQITPALSEQWDLITNSLSVTRHTPSIVQSEEAHTLKILDWSSISVDPQGKMIFFQIMNRYQSKDDNSTKRIIEGQQIIGSEARRYLAREILNTLQKKNAISIEYSSGEELKDE